MPKSSSPSSRPQPPSMTSSSCMCESASCGEVSIVGGSMGGSSATGVAGFGVGAVGAVPVNHETCTEPTVGMLVPFARPWKW